MATESFRRVEDRDAAYEYLCRLEEAKKWLEAILNIQLPPAMELEMALQNGVILCRLGMKLLPGDPMWKKVYDPDESKFKKKGLDYRYTDNINFWLISLHKLGLPKVFYPVMTDIYHMTNMPKLIYCLHALSHLMKRQGKVQQAVDDLYGRAKFSPTAISRTSKTLRPSELPAFSVVENLVEEELQYQALGLSDSFDESEPPAMNGALKNGEGGEEEEEEEAGRRDVVEPVFDDPKYVSSSWAQGTLLKLNGTTDLTDTKTPFAEVQCHDNTITAHLYSKKPRRKKKPSIVDKALENVNTSLDSGSDQQIFSALQNKEGSFPFVYSDHQERYAKELKRERMEGIPKNVLIVYSGLTRETCVDLLEKMNPGAFIVRTSKTVSGAVVFSFRNQTGIKHWQMTDKEGKYYWGASTMYESLESFIEHFADALSQVTHLHVYPGMTTALQPQIHSTEHQTMISKLRKMDGSLTYGQICRVIKGVNSEIRQDRKESVGKQDRESLRRRRAQDEQLIPKLALPRDWDSTMVISVNRVQAEQILNKEGSPGSFLVRPSEKTLGDYALAFRTTSEIRHWKIVQDKDKFYVHPRPNPYDSLEEIIQHFQEAVGQETGLVMTPLVHNWSHDIIRVSGATVSGATSTADEETDPLKPLPISPVRHRSSDKSSTIGRTAMPSPSLSKLNPANLTSWTVEDVSQWLTERGLGQFVEVFQENLVDGECLMSLDNTLLKEDLGITALGHRSRIMKRVTELKTSVHPTIS